MSRVCMRIALLWKITSYAEVFLYVLRFLACIAFDFVLALYLGAQLGSPHSCVRSEARQFSFLRFWKRASPRKGARQAMAKIRNASGARVCDHARYLTQLVRGYPKPFT